MTTGTRASEQTQTTAAAAQAPLLIEEWLPAAAIGVECMRERRPDEQPPDIAYLHVWWARRPLTAARAAVLGSLLPADFPRDVFERLLGFGRPGTELVRIRRLMDAGVRIPGGFGVKRAFTRGLREDDLDKAHAAIESLWGPDAAVIDPMAGGGSIPLEAARLGLKSLANEYNPVACSVLEATTDYPFRFGPELAERARHWGREWLKRIEPRLVAISSRSGAMGSCTRTSTPAPFPALRPDTKHRSFPTGRLLKPKSGLASGGRTGGGQASWNVDGANPRGRRGARASSPGAAADLQEGQGRFALHRDGHSSRLHQGEGPGGRDGQPAVRGGGEDTAGSEVRAAGARDLEAIEAATQGTGEAPGAMGAGEYHSDRADSRRGQDC